MQLSLGNKKTLFSFPNDNCSEKKSQKVQLQVTLTTLSAWPILNAGIYYRI